MADDDLKFLIPEAARKRMEQYYKVSKGDGGSTNLNRSLDLMGDDAPRLNDKQREKLLENASEMTKKNAKWYDDWMAERINKRKAKGQPTEGIRSIESMKRRKDLSIMADVMSERLPDLPGYKVVDPPSVFSDNREKHTIQGVAEKLKAMNARTKKAEMEKQKSIASRMRKAGMKVVPKLGAVFGGPIGMGIAAASTLMDAKDAYALTESTMNPESEEDIVRQKHLADLMRQNEFY